MQQLSSPYLAGSVFGKLRRLISRLPAQNGAAFYSFPGLSGMYPRFKCVFAWVLERAYRKQLNESAEEFENMRGGLLTRAEFSSDASNSNAIAGSGLFALHYEPESTSFPEGLAVMNQLDAVV